MMMYTICFPFQQSFLEERLRVQDTCGVHNLHGMPALLAAIAGTFMAYFSSEEKWGRRWV